VGNAKLSEENPRKLSFDFNVCAEHNCTDEYCSDYPEVVSYAELKTSK